MTLESDARSDRGIMGSLPETDEEANVVEETTQKLNNRADLDQMHWNTDIEGELVKLDAELVTTGWRYYAECCRVAVF